MFAVQTEADGGVLLVRLNRPERLNAFNTEMHFALEKIWDRFEADPGLRVAILIGAGERAFSAGSDLKQYVAGDPVKLPPHGYGGLSHRQLSKPLIGAINGLAVGGGFEVALCCDLLIAADHAEFGLPEPRVGAAAIGGGLPRLCRKVPMNLAMGVLLAGKRLKADEAMRFGLVNEVVPGAQVERTARAWAREILLGAPLAIELTKALAEETYRGDVGFDVLCRSDEDPRGQALLASDDNREGMRAFVERRAPLWTGR